MKPDFFTYLPSEITNNIFSRLPIPTIAISKSVCKPWLLLLESDEFVNSHLAKSVPALAVLMPEGYSSPCTIFKIEDDHELESHNLHYHPLTKFDFPDNVEIVHGSVDGLLFLYGSESYYVCNPITRCYIKLRFPEELIRPYPKTLSYPEFLEDSVYSYPPSHAHGFGVSKKSGHYKVVWIYLGSVITHGGEAPRKIIPESECHVYTLGTESWRPVAPGALLEICTRASSSCVFMNSNLHWIATDSHYKLWISCFDLETESFSSLCTPLAQESYELVRGLSALGDCLCLCDNQYEEEFVIWMMKEYGVENSWTKQYVISKGPEIYSEGFEIVYPIKVFRDGDILMLWEDEFFFYYSSKTKTTQEISIIEPHRVNAILFTPSFVSLTSFGMVNVISF